MKWAVSNLSSEELHAVYTEASADRYLLYGYSTEQQTRPGQEGRRMARHISVF
jgi:hypothetical protein